MTRDTATIRPSALVTAKSRRTSCPFHDGVATLDLLLAELDPRDIELFDAALDLRSLAMTAVDAQACLEKLLELRARLDGRHYLAFYRVRCWARRTFRVEVRSRRGEPLRIFELPIDCARMEEVVDSSLSEAGAAEGPAHVRIVFAKPE